MPQTPNILALDVLVTGPEFRSDESRMAFARVAEAVEQFSAHTRDTIVLVRQPTDLDRDHFAILWSRGIGIVSFCNQTGIIHGSAKGPWHTEPGDARFANPLEQLVGPAKQIAAQAGNNDLPLSLVAIFTGPVRDLDIDTAGAALPSYVMSLEQAVSRSLVHIPNLLSAIDRKIVVIQHGEIERLALMLDRSGTTGELLAQNGASKNLEHIPVASIAGRRRSSLWVIPLILVAIALVIYFVVVSIGPSKVQLRDSTATASTLPAQNRPGLIVIEVPAEVQLFVSPQLYQSRLELDRALAHAEGQRYLPAKEQVIAYDSLTLSKGIYGYFKVDNAWRKGKLIQTFQHDDTIHIDNFLGPLP